MTGLSCAGCGCRHLRPEYWNGMILAWLLSFATSWRSSAPALNQPDILGVKVAEKLALLHTRGEIWGRSQLIKVGRRHVYSCYVIRAYDGALVATVVDARRGVVTEAKVVKASPRPGERQDPRGCEE